MNLVNYQQVMYKYIFEKFVQAEICVFKSYEHIGQDPLEESSRTYHYAYLAGYGRQVMGSKRNCSRVGRQF
jgi:hypothetical protein